MMVVLNFQSVEPLFYQNCIFKYMTNKYYINTIEISLIIMCSEWSVISFTPFWPP